MMKVDGETVWDDGRPFETVWDDSLVRQFEAKLRGGRWGGLGETV